MEPRLPMRLRPVAAGPATSAPHRGAAGSRAARAVFDAMIPARDAFDVLFVLPTTTADPYLPRTSSTPRATVPDTRTKSESTPRTASGKACPAAFTIDPAPSSDSATRFNAATSASSADRRVSAFLSVAREDSSLPRTMAKRLREASTSRVASSADLAVAVRRSANRSRWDSTSRSAPAPCRASCERCSTLRSSSTAWRRALSRSPSSRATRLASLLPDSSSSRTSALAASSLSLTSAAARFRSVRSACKDVKDR